MVASHPSPGPPSLAGENSSPRSGVLGEGRRCPLAPTPPQHPGSGSRWQGSPGRGRLSAGVLGGAPAGLYVVLQLFSGGSVSLWGGHLCSLLLHGAGCQGCGGHCRGDGRGVPVPPFPATGRGQHWEPCSSVPWGGNCVGGLLPLSLTSSRGDPSAEPRCPGGAQAGAVHRVLAPMWSCTHTAEPPALPRSRLRPGLLSLTRGSQGGTQAPGRQFLTLQVPDPAVSVAGPQARLQPRGFASRSSLPSPQPVQGSGDTAPMSPGWAGPSRVLGRDQFPSQCNGGTFPARRRRGLEASLHSAHCTVGRKSHIPPPRHTAGTIAHAPSHCRGATAGAWGHQGPLEAWTHPSPCPYSPCGTPEPFPAPGAARQPQSQGWGRGWARQCQSTAW